MSRLQENGAPPMYFMGEWRPRPTETRSARGKLVQLHDTDAPTLKHGDALIAQFGSGLGQVLGFDPHELYRVREVRA
jgi:hypothetical protein